jgi:iron complex outermembrane receptor protein
MTRVFTYVSLSAAWLFAIIVSTSIAGAPKDTMDSSKSIYGGNAKGSVVSIITKKPVGESSSLFELDRLVITGSKTVRPIENLSASVSLVNEREIAKLDVENVDEALRSESGIYNKRSKGLMESMAGLVMRGFAGTDQVLVLLDGQPMNNGYVGRPQFNNIPIEDVAKIEVARGPFSSLYGGNAMGGVVNIITRTPVEPKLAFRGGLGGGPDAGYNQNIYIGYEDAPVPGKLGVTLSFSHKRDEGYVTNDLLKNAKPGTAGTLVTGVKSTGDRYGKQTFHYGEGGVNGAENRAIGGKLSWTVNGSHSLRTGLYLSWYDYWSKLGSSYMKDSLDDVRDTGAVKFAFNDTTYTFRVDQRNFLDGDGGQGHLYYTLSYRGELTEKLAVAASGGCTHQFENWYVSLGTTSKTTRSGGPGKFNSTPNTKGNIDVHVELKGMIPDNVIIAGVGAEGSMSETREYNLKDWQRTDEHDTIMYKAGGNTAVGAFFINDEVTIFETGGFVKNVILNAGVRADYWRTMAGMNHDYASGKVVNEYDARSKISWSPRGGLTLNLQAAKTWAPTFWIAGGKAFRPPTVYDLYRTWLSTGSNEINESNPDLKPETMWSGEMGTTQRFIDSRITVSATAFYNKLTDMIYSATTGDTTPEGWSIDRKMNIGKARIRGVEMSVALRPVGQVTLSGSYGFTDAYILELDELPDLVDKHLTLVPRHTAGFGLQVDLGMFSGRIGSRYAAKRYSADDNSDTENGVFGSRDPFFITDCNITFRPVTRFAVTFHVDNLFDFGYYDYYRAPGRTFSGNVKVEFR